MQTRAAGQRPLPPQAHHPVPSSFTSSGEVALLCQQEGLVPDLQAPDGEGVVDHISSHMASTFIHADSSRSQTERRGGQVRVKGLALSGMVEVLLLLLVCRAGVAADGREPNVRALDVQEQREVLGRRPGTHGRHHRKVPCREVVRDLPRVGQVPDHLRVVAFGGPQGLPSQGHPLFAVRALQTHLMNRSRDASDRHPVCQGR
mmetsp:Transcript_97373/g.231680  ORF Transcript_97373/g.231680 Transcript_97373/m.231680 type:complete len:203 (-) Transcript_97373:72-680(-)